jgi:hypothetical protein
MITGSRPRVRRLQTAWRWFGAWSGRWYLDSVGILLLSLLALALFLQWQRAL